MARPVMIPQDAMDLIEGLLLTLFAFLTMGALLLCIAQTKRPEFDNPQPEGPSENQSEQRKKARHEAWMKLIQEKNVTCEK
ncbi:unnamed protein product, partial [Ilex paraguariensis]